MEALKEKANQLRESLEKIKVTTEQMGAAFNTFDRRCSTLDAAIRPIQEEMLANMRSHENVSKSLKKTEDIVSQFDRIREAEVVIIKGPSEDLDGFLKAMDQLLQISQFFDSHKSYEESESTLSRVNLLLADATKMAETEFNKMLTDLSKPMDPESLLNCLPRKANASAVLTADLDDPSNSSRRDELETDTMQETPSDKLPTLISPQDILLLQNLAIRLVCAGHHMECLHIYRDARANVLQKSLHCLGVQKRGEDELQNIQWESLEAEILNWIDVMRISVKLLFAGERKLCDQVLKGIKESFLDQCFVEVTSSSLATLLSFGEAVVNIQKSHENLFMLLDMYEMMCELQPEMEAMFVSNERSEMLQGMVSLRTRLVATSAEKLLEFRELVEKDSTNNPSPDGYVHPLSSYVMDYLKFLFDYQVAVTQLLLEYKTGDQEEGLQFTPLVLGILEALHTNLETKSKHFEDLGQSHLFLMNNIHYMVTSVRKTEAAKELLGEDWIERQRKVVQVKANLYRSVSWAKVLDSISSQGLLSSSGGSSNMMENTVITASKKVIRERFKTFNTEYEELYNRQCLWKVHDLELRESLRLAVAELLLPAYRSFIERFRPKVENSKRKCIKYNPEDIEKMLEKLFGGETPS